MQRRLNWHLSASSNLFFAEGISILSMLREVKTNLGRIRTFLPESESLLSRTESALIELDDLAAEIEKLAVSIEADPQRLAQVNNRLDSIYSLIQKHRVSDLNELIRKKEEIKDLISSIVTSDERLIELETLLEKEVNSLKIFLKRYLTKERMYCLILNRELLNCLNNLVFQMQNSEYPLLT